MTEPLSHTLRRTIAIAAITGAFLARWWGGWRYWPLASLVTFWFSFGGHWVELWFLNTLRPRVNAALGVQLAARAVAWCAGGTVLAIGATLTAMTFVPLSTAQKSAWWFGGLALITVELVVHLALQLRGQPSAYNGRG